MALVENPDLIDFLYDNGATVVIKMRTFDEKFQDVLVQREGYAKEIATALYLLTEK
ncbi:MAG: hypothetical protein LBO09_05170 [Candidatus Peribacteria bacterium]|nr:hypothetical protein [Candidatus Peribacteria bacterium]